jgi:dihydroorotate dehydrogenase (NAD+) catalytic subunit
MAGATAVQVGTASFIEPLAALDVLKGIDSFLDSRGFASVSDVTGIINR